MKFLSEVEVSTKFETKIEESADGKKEYYIEGIFMQGNKKNRNGRIYPTSTLKRAVESYCATHVHTNRALGELNHPPHVQVNPKEASHRIVDLWVEGDNIMGKALVLNTPNGQIVKALLDGGTQIGVSSRGVGSLKERAGVKEVQEDFHLSTVDIVLDPSAPDAFVNQVMESKEYTVIDGMIMEVDEATVKAILEKHGVAPKNEPVVEEKQKVKTLDTKALFEAFEKLLK